MLPERILKKDFDLIKAELDKNNKIELVYELKHSDYNKDIHIQNLLDHCYKLDENEIPESYKLQQREHIIPGYKLETEASEAIVQLIT